VRIIFSHYLRTPQQVSQFGDFMAKRYTSTLQVRFWKEHTCVACNSTYSYLLERKAVGTGASAQAAHAKLQSRIGEIVKTETDMQPCPTCGLYQPDMIGRRRAKRRLQIFVVALIALIVLLCIRAADGLQTDVLSKAAAVVFGLAVLAHLALEVQNANSNLEGNKQRAADRIANGQVRYKPGQFNARPDDFAGGSRSMIHLVALGMLLVSIPLTVAAELARTMNHWPMNETCYPPVIGPGDKTRIYMPQPIESVKSYWRGWPYAIIEVNGQKKELVSSTNQNDWGSTIYVKSEEKSTSSKPWVDVTLPNMPEIAGKQVKCDISLKLEYPQMNSSGTNFSVVHGVRSHTLTLDLGPAGAGTEYNFLWWAGTAGGGALLLLASLLLYNQGIRQAALARPTQAIQA
jgi:hypothetical protein